MLATRSTVTGEEEGNYTMDTNRIGFGLIGLGQIHHAHRRGYEQAADRARIAAVCDVDEAIAKQEGIALGCAAYTDYHALLADPGVDAVDITLPHNLHYEVARAALDCGKHVLVEKPLAATSQQCLALIELARKNGRAFTVAENTRFVTAYQEAETLLKAGVLGTPRLIRTLISGSEVERLQNTSLWKGRRDGTIGGAIFDAGPHSFYLLKWLFGDIEGVYAVQSRLMHESQVEDHAVVGGQLANGALFTTEYTFTAEIPWGERCEIYGSEGSLIIDQLCNPPATHYHGAEDYTGTPLPAVSYDPRGWKVASIAAGVTDFIDAVWGQRPPTIDPRDGYYTIKVAEKAYESVAASGKLVAL